MLGVTGKICGGCLILLTMEKIMHMEFSVNSLCCSCSCCHTHFLAVNLLAFLHEDLHHSLSLWQVIGLKRTRPSQDATAQEIELVHQSFKSASNVKSKTVQA